MEFDKNNLPQIIDIPSKRIRDLTGKQFGKLRVIGYIGNDSKDKSMWLCQCDCDNHTFKSIVGTELTKGSTKSCGCFGVENTIKRSTTHGMSKTRLYRIHRGMHERCYNKKGKDYANYGGRGITICDEWKNNYGFINFYNWAINNGYQSNLTIDRINVNGNYEPNNCRWETIEKQNGNKTTSIQITYDDNIYNLLDFYNEVKPIVSYDTFKQRIFVFNWDIDEAINIPSNMSKELYNFIKALEEELKNNTKAFITSDFKIKYNISNSNFTNWIKQDCVINILNKYNYTYINEPVLILGYDHKN